MPARAFGICIGATKIPFWPFPLTRGGHFLWPQAVSNCHPYAIVCAVLRRLLSLNSLKLPRRRFYGERFVKPAAIGLAYAEFRVA